MISNLKRTSTLRRVNIPQNISIRQKSGNEGDVCAFELSREATSFTVESIDGRLMAIVPGDTFFATPGHRESTRWVVGGVPLGGLVPDHEYWVLADSGIVGEFVGESPLPKGHLARVNFRGVAYGRDGRRLNIRYFATKKSTRKLDHGAPIYLILGTSSEVGKTTAGVTVLSALRFKGYTTVVALKATGTSSFAEIAKYQDFGAAQAMDCVDFGLPTTYPSGRNQIDRIFNEALNYLLALPADAIVVECGGDLFGANVPQFLSCLKQRRSDFKIVLAAPDALAALGAKQTLRDMGLSISLITGPCTDTPTLRTRTESLCEIPAVNMARATPELTF